MEPELTAGKQAITLEDMSAKFDASLVDHGKEKLAKLKLRVSGPTAEPPDAVGEMQEADGTAEAGTAV
jgi:hypothetical protein